MTTIRNMLFGVFVLAAQNAIATTEPLRILTEDVPPYQIVENGQLIGGSAFLLVKQALDISEIDTQIEVLPWARAYEIALNRPNTLLFSIVRTPEREALFHWIAPIGLIQFRFYSSRANPSISIQSRVDALRYIAAAVRNSAEADTLINMGFNEGENLLLLKDYMTVWDFIHRGRADITYAHIPYEKLIESLGLAPEDFYPHQLVFERYSLYVAANKNTSTDVIEQLRNALIKLAPQLQEAQPR